MIARLIRRPIGVCSFTLAMALLGVLAARQLPVALLPPVELPQLTVRCEQPGASAAQLEEQLLKPLENAVITLPGLAHLEGRAVAGAVELRLSLHAQAVVDEVVAHLDGLINNIRRPEGVDRPRVLRYDPATEPMMRLVLESVPGGPGIDSLAVTAHDTLVPQLESLTAVASVRLRGGREAELRIIPDPQRLAAAKLTAEAIDPAIIGAISTRTLGSVLSAAGQQQVSLSGSANRVADIARVSLAPGIALGDVATIEQRLADPTELALALPRVGESGRPVGALLIEILGQADAGVVAASDAVRARLAGIGEREAGGGDRWRFAGGRLSLVTDRATAVRTAINEVKAAGIEGAILAWLVLLVFLRALRPALVVFLAIPLSVVGTFLLMSMFGVGLNLMSLGGVALGIGMLVDTAIVVLEAADRVGAGSVDQGKRLAAISLGVGEIIGAVVASCLTSIAVFVPLAFLPGILGRLFYDQAFTVSASHVVSLAVGLILVPTLLALPQVAAAPRFGTLAWPPVSAGGFARRWRFLPLLPVRLAWLACTSLRWLAALFLRALLAVAIALVRLAAWPLLLLLRPCAALCRVALGAFERVYARALDAVLARPLYGLALFAIALLLGLAFIPRLPVRLMPPSLARRFILEVELPQSTSVTQCRDWGFAFLASLRGWRSDLDAVALAGEDATYAADLSKRGDHQLQLVATLSRTAADHAAEDAFLSELENRALAAGAVSAAARIPALFDLGLGSSQALDLAIRGNDAEILRRMAVVSSAGMRAIGCRGVVTTATAIGADLIVVPDADRLLAAHLGFDEVNKALGGAAAVRTIAGFVPRGGAGVIARTLPIRVLGALRERAADDLASLNLGTAEHPIPLSSVATLTRSMRGGLILHSGGALIAKVTALSLPPGISAQGLTGRLRGSLNLPVGYDLISDGLSAATSRSLAAMGGTLALSVFLVLVLMAIQFESIAQPLLVILAVPMAAAGAFPALWALGHGLDVMSGIGLVVLIGVAVANAIVLVSTANLRRQQGFGAEQAIRAAGRERLRPILMTTCTSVLGLLPLALGWGEAVELRAPLAVAVMGGLCSSTVLVLLSLPAVLLWAARRSAAHPPR